MPATGRCGPAGGAQIGTLWERARWRFCDWIRAARRVGGSGRPCGGGSPARAIVWRGFGGDRLGAGRGEAREAGHDAVEFGVVGDALEVVAGSVVGLEVGGFLVGQVDVK